MFIYAYCWLIVNICLSTISTQDNNPLSIDNEPEEKVILYIDTAPKNAISAKSTADSFACHECTDCNQQAEVTVRSCRSDIAMCYTSKKRINKTHEIINRGCSASPYQCTVPDDYSTNIFDTVTCCTSTQCNQSIRLQAWIGVFLFHLCFLIINL